MDASAAVAWILRDGSTEDEVRIDDVFATGFALVPELWHCEVANALRSALRAGRIDESFVREACELLGELDIRTDVVGVPVQRLALEAHATGLTAYDTCYLLLARDRGLPLVTLDAALASAAALANVDLVL